MLRELLTLNVFAFLLIFVRIGAAIAVMPGLSSAFVSVRMRLAVALAVSFVLMPVIGGNLPAPPSDIVSLAVLIFGEMLIGVFMGTIGRIIVGSLQTAGTLIALSSSMANAMIQDPIAEQQSSVISGFLLTMGATVIFVADLHHLMIRSLVESYTVFAPGAALPFGDLSIMMARHVADSFALGLQLAAPFIIVGLTYYIAIGLLGRLMPQLQVFFFGLPFQISVQIWVLSIAISGIMLVFARRFEAAYQGFSGN